MPYDIAALGADLRQMSDDMAQVERRFTAERAAAGQEGLEFELGALCRLHQVKALRAALELAIACADADNLVAKQLVRAATGQVDAWNEVEKQARLEGGKR